jgi:hypothetical protein
VRRFWRGVGRETLKVTVISLKFALKPEQLHPIFEYLHHQQSSHHGRHLSLVIASIVVGTSPRSSNSWPGKQPRTLLSGGTGSNDVPISKEIYLSCPWTLSPVLNLSLSASSYQYLPVISSHSRTINMGSVAIQKTLRIGVDVGGTNT